MPVPLRLVSAVAAAALLTGACSGSDPVPAGREGPAEAGGVLKVGLAAPHRGGLAVDTDDALLLSQLGVAETLVRAAADGVAEPGLATSWQQVDPTTWRFALRDDVVFHDGTRLDAEAVVTALTHVTSVTAPPRSVAGTGLTARADGASVVVSTDAPDPVLPLRLSSPNTAVLAPAAYAATPPSPVRAGTGPFVLTRVQEGVALELVRHDAYWDGEVLLDGASIRFLPDAAARTAALRAGDVDVADNLPATALPELEAAGDLELLQYAAPRTTSMYVNTRSGPLADVRVRQALTAAVDRPALVEAVLEGTGAPAVGVFGPAVPWGESAPPGPADPETARTLLAEAGHGPEAPLSLRLWTYTSRPELPELATAVQGMLAAVGVRTDVRTGEYDALEPAVLDGDFDLFLLSRSYLLDFPDAGGFLRSDFACDGTYNLNGWCSAELDAVLDRLPATPDGAQRQQLFGEAAALLQRDAVGVPLLHTGSITGVRDGVRGLEVDPLERYLLTPAVSLQG